MSHHDPDAGYPRSSTSGGNVVLGIVLGCLVATLVVTGGIGACMFVLYREVSEQVRDTGAELTRLALRQTVQDSYLPSDDKQIMYGQIDRVVDKYKGGEIELATGVRVLTEIMSSPVVSLLVLNTVEHRHLNPSGLDDAEKEAGRLTLARVGRGLVEESIPHGKVRKAISSISETVVVEEGGERHERTQLKRTLTTEELRDFLAQCKDLADRASIPDEPYKVPYGEQFKTAIDRALGEE